jgi:hypothetical protein
VTLTIHAKNYILLSQCEGIGNSEPEPYAVCILLHFVGKVCVLKTQFMP